MNLVGSDPLLTPLMTVMGILTVVVAVCLPQLLPTVSLITLSGMVLTEVLKKNPDGLIGRKGKRTTALSVCMGSKKNGPV